MIKSAISIEKITISDAHYIITEVSVSSGSKVAQGQFLFSFETSKSSVDVDAPVEGFLYHQLETGGQVMVGQIVAYITDDTSHSVTDLFQKEPENNIIYTANPEIIFSAKAAKLISEYNIDSSVFEGKSQVREKDVHEYILKTSAKNIPETFTRVEKNDIIIIGGRGGAKMVIEAIRSTNSCTIKGIIDTELPVNELVLGVTVLGGENMLESLREQGYRNIVLSFTLLNNLSFREEKYQEYKKKGFIFPNIIHQRATVEPSVKMGEGNIILANSMLGSDVRLGNINFVNTGAMICHDTTAYQNNHFAPNAVLAGRIQVGSNNIFGMCSTTYFDVIIGNRNIINNGVNIFSNIKDNQIIRG